MSWVYQPSEADVKSLTGNSILAMGKIRNLRGYYLRR